MAGAAIHHNPNLELALITDHPELHGEFPGNLTYYSRDTSNPWLREFIAKRREIKEIAGGYWLHTLERIFALNAILPDLGDRVLIHIESDVYLNLSDQLIRNISENLSKVAVPRFSSTRGIASILIAPSADILREGLDKLGSLLMNDSSIDSDMILLGKALNLDIFQEVQTNPSMPMVTNDEKGVESRYIFDAAAIGQYLFGQDPFHTDGQRISGFINPDAPFNPTKYRYSILESQQSKSQAIFMDNIEVINLHIHSKLSLPPISRLEPIWTRATQEANGSIERTTDAFKPDLIHTQSISLLNRLRIARRNGLVRSLIRAAHKRISKVFKL
jgi:hypothetical protein